MPDLSIMLSEHSDAVLADFGHTPAAIAALRGAGVLGAV
jgi:hypothetical protein